MKCESFSQEKKNDIWLCVVVRKRTSQVEHGGGGGSWVISDKLSAYTHNLSSLGYRHLSLSTIQRGSMFFVLLQAFTHRRWKAEVGRS